MTTPATPVDAATVLLLRDGPPLEIFMVRRHGKSRFMGGMYVFPGGKRDEGDSTIELEPLCRGVTGADAARILGDGLPPTRALGHFVAAVRETFEEAGVLLADCDTPQAELEAARLALQEERTHLLTLAQRHGWTLRLDRLRYFSHWVTPPREPRRYSARFFLAAAPRDQDACHDAREVFDGFWISAADAIARYYDGKIDLPPPTLRTLEQLLAFGDVEAALAAAPHAPVLPHAPRLVRTGEGIVLVLDGDPLHPDTPGTLHRRFYLDGNRWRTDFSG